MLSPVGFWSYARDDDSHSDGQLSQLRVIVGKQIGLQYGEEVPIWQDITAIPFGADWATTIDQSIGQTSFFLPIITPRFLRSRNCHDEFVAFRDRMRALRRDDLIFPIHYVSIDGMQESETAFGADLAVLRRHQWADFRPLFYLDPRAPEVRRWAGDLATSILRATRRPMPAAVVTPPPPVVAPPPPPAPVPTETEVSAAMAAPTALFQPVTPPPAAEMPQEPQPAHHTRHLKARAADWRRCRCRRPWRRRLVHRLADVAPAHAPLAIAPFAIAARFRRSAGSRRFGLARVGCRQRRHGDPHLHGA